LADLSMRRAIVTGGSSGIGEAVVRELVARGAAVVFFGRDPDRVRSVAASSGATGVVVDVADSAIMRAAVADAVDKLGGLNCLVNNAGLMLHSAPSQDGSDDWRQMIDVNVLSLLEVTSAALPALKEADGADIVNIGSIAHASVAMADFAVYSATKAAAVRITEGMRLDFTKSNIRVCLIHPGLTNTPGFGPGIRNDQLRTGVTAAKEAAGMPPSAVAEEVVRVIAMPRDRYVGELSIHPFTH
jgi:2-keto-3-deoxy-L-fuconate dehydrogenase